jgi:hypothetical protein
MKNLSNWNYYYNEEPGDRYRANLVYTAYVSPDNKTFCMRFIRDINYHTDPIENTQWTDELLEERFRRELKFYDIAKHSMPVTNIIDVDEASRSIYLDWPGDDFYMMGYKSSYENVLPNWREQVKQRYSEMWSLGILKFSMHPNSWLVFSDGILRPFNWFFTFSIDEPKKSIGEYLIQISDSRQEKLFPLLEKFQIDIDKKYNLWDLQNICFESFRHNYPSDLVDEILDLKKEFKKI